MINQSCLETAASSTQSANTRMQTTKSFGAASSQDAIKALSHNARLNHQMAGIGLDVWKDETAQMIIDHAHKAAASISALLKETEQHELLLRALLWEIGRLYLTVYNWYTESGPAMADILINCLQSTDGKNGLKSMSPRYASLVLRIYEYLQALCKAKNQTRSRSRCPSPNPVSEEQLEELRTLDPKIHGFSVRDGTSGLLKLPKILPCHVDEAKIPKVAKQCLVDFIFDTLILEHILESDKYFNTERIQAHRPEHIRARFLIRGRILSK